MEGVKRVNDFCEAHWKLEWGPNIKCHALAEKCLKNIFEEIEEEKSFCFTYKAIGSGLFLPQGQQLKITGGCVWIITIWAPTAEVLISSWTWVCIKNVIYGRQWVLYDLSSH